MNSDSGDEGNDELTCVRSDESDKSPFHGKQAYDILFGKLTHHAEK